MKKQFTNILIYIALSALFAYLPPDDSYAQSTPHWQQLPAAPIARADLLKNDDLFFVNDSTGWVVTRTGEIFKTADAGLSWTLQYTDDVFFRAVGFANPQSGWAGNLMAEEGKALYHTADGGVNWSPVTNIPNPQPLGICGIYVVNEDLIYAVGRIMGPPIFIRTRNGGISWESFDLSDYAGMLVDVYFWNPDTGIIIGGTLDSYSLSKAVVLFTTDGGESWEIRYTGLQKAEWGWKISFPDPDTGYVSIQRSTRAESSTEYFIKTMDGGRTWEEMPFSNTTYSSQAIGFISPSVGWMGSFLADKPTLETLDGGVTWSDAGFGQNVNRIMFLSSGIGYASGRSVYKFTSDSVSTNITPILISPTYFSLAQNYPNPFNGSTQIPYTLSHYGYVSLYIFTLRGEQVARLVNVMQNPGDYNIKWNPENIASGIYFYQIRISSAVGSYSKTKKLLYLK